VQGRRNDLTSTKLDEVRLSNSNANVLRRLARDHKEDRELHGLLVKHRPSNHGSNQHKARTFDNVKSPAPKPPTGNTRAYIEQRLQAEFREAMKGEPGRPEKGCESQPINTTKGTGNKAYTCERLRREAVLTLCLRQTYVMLTANFRHGGER
jgi:hypothetical protein